MKTNLDYGSPIKMWVNEVEPKAMEQIQNLASLPFVFKHVAIMPDVHAGKGMPIGGVLATRGVVIPNAVGVDIGCGMCAVKTSLNREQLPKEILTNGVMKHIRAEIPLGFDWHNTPQDEALMPSGHNFDKMPMVRNLYKSALKQLGTLGGGNHFIEIQYDETDAVWIMIHSGSRNLGAKIADYHTEKARFWCEKWYANPIKGLEYMPIESDIARVYMSEMNYCVDFALANRALMMERIKAAFVAQFPEVKFEEMINIAHNYASWENHFGENVLVHRKGATRAFSGEVGIIPGSQGTASYIVEGLGNAESFMSCSHGAGRLMSRTAAKANLNLQDEIARLDSAGVVHAMRTTKDLDEAPSAYKDIDEVIACELDLIRPIVKLRPLAVIKG